MIIELIWLMFTLAFALLFLGYNIKVPYVVMMGWVMIFLLSLGFSSAGIEYGIGQTEVLQGDNVTTITTYNYSNYENKPIFLYLALISGLGFVSVFYTKDLW